MHELMKRCDVICGKNSPDCFAANANHLECVTDIIINKIWAARAILELGIGASTGEELVGHVRVATNEMDELIRWVKAMPMDREHRAHGGVREALCRQ